MGRQFIITTAGIIQRKVIPQPRYHSFALPFVKGIYFSDSLKAIYKIKMQNKLKKLYKCDPLAIFTDNIGNCINSNKRKNDNGKSIAVKGRILLMDDDDVFRETVGRYLARIGYEIQFATNGIETIELYRNAININQPFDAIIMDITIPGGMGAKETIKHLLNIDPEAKAIVSSGLITDPAISNYREYSFRGALPKPYSTKELNKVLHNVINGS